MKMRQVESLTLVGKAKFFLQGSGRRERRRGTERGSGKFVGNDTNEICNECQSTRITFIGHRYLSAVTIPPPRVPLKKGNWNIFLSTLDEKTNLRLEMQPPISVHFRAFSLKCINIKMCEKLLLFVSFK